MDYYRKDAGRDPLVDLKRRMRRITDRFTWKRTFLFGALLVWLMKSDGALVTDIDGRSYLGIWTLAAIGCWTASGWLLDIPRLLFPDVKAFQHLRRSASQR